MEEQVVYKQHELKIWPLYFKEVEAKNKTFELRKDDRGIKVGDQVRLREWNNANQYTGKELFLEVTYVLKDCEPFGLKDGYCIFGFKIVNI